MIARDLREHESAQGDSRDSNLTAFRAISIAAPLTLFAYLVLREQAAGAADAFSLPVSLAVVLLALGCPLGRWLLGRCDTLDERGVAVVCACYQALMLACVAVVDVLAVPELPGCLVHIVAVAAAGAFALPVAWSVGAVAVPEALFVMLSFVLKEASVARVDLAFAAVGLAVALLGIWLASRQRAREDEVNSVYKTLSVKDPLTGLSNRSGLLTGGRDIVDRISHEIPVTVIMLDVDDFKRVNDSFGHIAGDEVLKGVAQILAGQFRATDVVARFGGDEFTVIAIGLSDREVLNGKLAAIQCSMEGLGRRVVGCPLSLSMGAVVAYDAAGDLDGLMHEADCALYAAKRAGKKGYRIMMHSAGEGRGCEGDDADERKC